MHVYPLGNRYTVHATPRGVEHYTLFEVRRRDGVTVAREISAPDFGTMETREARLVKDGALPKLSWAREDREEPRQPTPYQQQQAQHQPAPQADLSPPLHLVACRTSTGSVTFFASRRPVDQLIHLGTELQVDRRTYVPTPHAERIVAELQAEFAEDRLTQWAGRPYFHMDWERVEATVAEFDMRTGQRIRRAGVEVGQPVQVQMGLADSQSKLRGEVRAIAEKRYLVHLDKPVGDMKAGWFTRQLLKPIVRVPALGDAA